MGMLNKVQTVANTKYFIKKILPSIAWRSGVGTLEQLALPKLNLVRFKDYERIDKCQRIIIAVNSTFNGLTNKPKKPYKTILANICLNGLSETESAQKVGYSSSRHRELKKEALIEFATLFKANQEKEGIKPVIDLTCIQIKEKD